MESEVVCPNCASAKIERMPVNACLQLYECENCRATLRPKAGDCCIFCSFGSVACPSIQHEREKNP